MSIDFEPTDAQAPSRRQLGDFILLDEIGRGGVGMVYRARQISLERQVALRVLPSAALDPESEARFQREAEAVGGLSHPGIVPIFGVGCVDGTCFYATDLVEGPSLYQVLDGLRGADPQDLQNTLAEEIAVTAIYPSLQESQVPAFLAGSAYPASCAALIMEVAGALTAAHQAEVIHSDLKPSSILVHPAGRPVLVDFGLAPGEVALGMTQTGDAAGTLAYMAPEQAAGTPDADARVDVYGLGATLYEMLTLRPPFEGKHSAELMRAIQDDDPVPPRRLNSRVPKALEAIVLTCLAKDPDQRYASTADLSSDLRSFLAGSAIQVRSRGMLGAIGRRMERYKRSVYVTLVAVMSALLVGLLVGLVILDASRQEGRGELIEARTLLAGGQALESHAAYMRALALLGDRDWVTRERLQAYRGVFPSMYAGGRFDVLRGFLETLAPAELDIPDYHQFRRRIRGMGNLSIATTDKDQPRVYVRGARSGNFESGWRRLSVDGALSTGPYLVRIQAPGMENVIRATRVDRDQTAWLRTALQPIDSVPSGMSLVDPGESLAFAVDREEFTVSRYSELLASIEDPDLASEMVPLGWSEQVRTNVPVTGLSHRQARIASRLLGCHLLSRAEYLQAATAGLPELKYPWGHQFDNRRVVGDPRYSSQPLAGPSRPMGASPGGILHLVGNVAEPLSSAGGRTILAAGGSYLSEPRDLTVRSFVVRASVHDQSPGAGLRLARFLPGSDDPVAEQDFRRCLLDFSTGPRPYIVNRWRVQAGGHVELHQGMAVAAEVRSMDLPALPGLVPWKPPQVSDRSGNPLPWRSIHEDGELRGYRVDFAATGEGLTSLTAVRSFEPLSGLHGQGDAYCLRLPLSNRAEQAVDSIELPLGSRVQAVWPTPDAAYSRGGVPVMVWYRGVVGCRSRHAATALVLFRRDGGLSERLPAFKPVAEFVGALFAALGDRDAARLAPMLADDCRFLPGALGRSRLLESPQSWDTYTGARVLDVTSVGQILTVELQVSWRPAGTPRSQPLVERWPLRAMLRRTASGFELVRLMPATWTDLGHLQGGTYHHPGLAVTVEPPAGVLMRRVGQAMVEMQLELRPASGASNCSVTMFGGMSEGTEPAASLRMRLATSSPAGERGERLPQRHVDRPGVVGMARLPGTSERWMFEEADGWRYERWTFLSQGRRQFLVRSVARGGTRDLARKAFDLAQDWFQTVTLSLCIK
ncbi:MAG: serine/threonine-protein kinase [Planctomycetota bacterium]|nr:serine/threonine-protein kinase [Planctomycetota bacterium]